MILTYREAPTRIAQGGVLWQVLYLQDEHRDVAGGAIGNGKSICVQNFLHSFRLKHKSYLRLIFLAPGSQRFQHGGKRAPKRA